MLLLSFFFLFQATFLPLLCTDAFMPLKNHRHHYASKKILANNNNAVSRKATAADSSSSPESSIKKIAEGSIVTIDCRLKPDGDFVPEPLFDGIVLEDFEPPVRLTFSLGKGNYLPGLHDLISTMTIDETIENVGMDAGWGSRNPELVVQVPFEKIPDLDKSAIKVGVQLVMAQNVPCTVTQVDEDSFTIDANPPLAGASYLATVKLINVEEGPLPWQMEYHNQEEMCNDDENAVVATSKYQVATFALGCFWGGELEYMREPGVVATKVGYTQGNVDEPTYEQVCSGTTGHTEAMMITFDPTVVSYDRLVHLAMDRLGENKYLLNQVGNDRGTQYRHGVYYHNDEQKEIANKIIQSYGEDCVTECLPATKFWDAEEYHQQYLLKGGQSAKKGEDASIRCYG